MTAANATRGRRNNDVGKRTERAVVNYLRANGWPDAATTRNRDGGRQAGDGDICGIPCVLDVKAWGWGDLAVQRWLDQLVDERGDSDRPMCLVWKVPGVADPARWVAIVHPPPYTDPIITGDLHKPRMEAVLGWLTIEAEMHHDPVIDWNTWALMRLSTFAAECLPRWA